MNWPESGDGQATLLLETSTIKRGDPRRASCGDGLHLASSFFHPHCIVQDRPLSHPVHYETYAYRSRQPCHYKRRSFHDRPALFAVSSAPEPQAPTESLNSTRSTTMALKSLTSSPTLRMSRRVPSPLLDSPISEEDQRQVNSQESPYSAALARSASPTSTRQHKFIKLSLIHI